MTDVDTSTWIRDLSEKLDKSRAEAADLRHLVEEAQAREDRLKGELAEARRLLDLTRRHLELPDEHEMTVTLDAYFAATPDEQAQPTYEDGEIKPAPLKPERLLSASPIKAAEQAQGEGAPTLEKLNARLRIEVGNRRDLAIRVDGIDEIIDKLGQDTATQGAMVDVQNQVAELAKRVDGIDERLKRQESRGPFSGPFK